MPMNNSNHPEGRLLVLLIVVIAACYVHIQSFQRVPLNMGAAATTLQVSPTLQVLQAAAEVTSFGPDPGYPTNAISEVRAEEDRPPVGISPRPCPDYEHESAEWWNLCGSIVSRARIREGGSYDNQPDGPVVDFEDVVVAGGKVHVYGIDSKSASVLNLLTGRKLTGKALRVEKAPDMPVEVHEGPMPRGYCDPTAMGHHALYFVKPWYWANLYHLFNDLTMVNYHVKSTPLSTGVRRSPRLVTLGHIPSDLLPAKQRSNSSDSHNDDDEVRGVPFLPWASIILRAMFPGGFSPGYELFKRRAPSCVGSLHWGSPLRVMSANGVALDERRGALLAFHSLVFQHACLRIMPTDRPREIPRQNNPSVSPISSTESWFRAMKHTGSPQQRRALLARSRKIKPDRPSDVSGRPPRVVFVIREKPPPGGPKKLTNRWYNAKGLAVLQTAFEQTGATFETCCNFDYTEPCAMAATFNSADIVVGLHGAGLTNAALASRGHVVVELKSHYNRASDLFKKIAQAREGGYMWVNTQQYGDGPGNGQALPLDLATSVASCAVALWHQGQSPSGSKAPPCACRPVGGGTTTDRIKPGVFGYAAVGHINECSLSNPAGVDCHAGLVTSWKPSERCTEPLFGFDSTSGEDLAEERPWEDGIDVSAATPDTEERTDVSSEIDYEELPGDQEAKEDKRRARREKKHLEQEIKREGRREKIARRNTNEEHRPPPVRRTAEQQRRNRERRARTEQKPDGFSLSNTRLLPRDLAKFFDAPAKATIGNARRGHTDDD